MNKRRRKKQQKKQQLSTLTRLGVGKREARTLANKGNEKTYQKTVTALKRKERLDRRFAELVQAGYTRSEAHKLKGRSDANIQKLTKKKRGTERARKLREDKFNKLLGAGVNEKEAKRLSRKSWDEVNAAVRESQGVGSYLIVGYKEKTESYTREEVNAYKKRYAKRGQSSTSGLVSSIDGWLESEPSGLIGDYKMSVTDDPDRSSNYYHRLGFMQLYRGKGEYLKSLLSMIDLMMILLYKPYERYLFIKDVVTNLKRLDNAAAQQNARKIEELFL